MMDPINPSVWRNAKRKTARSVMAVVIAKLETRLPATGGPRLRAPGRDRGLGEPDRQAAATAQASVVCGPVCDSMALLRNMVMAVSEALERQRAILDVVGIGRLSLPQPPAAGDPCNKVV